MDMSSKEIRTAVKKLQSARMKLARNQPFYASLLFHMQFSLDEMCETVYTDGCRIVFCPDYLIELQEPELEFVLMHEVLHAALKHTHRMRKEYDFDLYSTACDIVVNSNIRQSCGGSDASITLKGKTCTHLTPDGREGYFYSVEEVYAFLQEQEQEEGEGEGEGFDDHTYWEYQSEEDAAGSGADGDGEWAFRMIEAAQQADRAGGSGQGSIPYCAAQIIDAFCKPQTDWRTVLDLFVQEEVNDYSFNPPDRRFQESPFLLPDYNEKVDSVKDLLFMIDTSASMTDEMIRQAYSEIKGAIDQFDGHLEGWLGFFDTAVTEPQPFMDEEELKIIRPQGRGGTSFQCVFDYIRMHGEELEPQSIIILTDGYALFPPEKDAQGIPVLWLINNENVTPPWGKMTRITAE